MATAQFDTVCVCVCRVHCVYIDPICYISSKETVSAACREVCSERAAAHVTPSVTAMESCCHQSCLLTHVRAHRDKPLVFQQALQTLVATDRHLTADAAHMLCGSGICLAKTGLDGACGQAVGV